MMNSMLRCVCRAFTRPLLAAGLALAAALPVQAQSSGPAPAAVEAAIRKALDGKLGQGVKIDAISKTPYADLYEVRAGADILYIDETGRYVFQGSVIDLSTGRNLSRDRSEALQAENDRALRSVLWSQDSLKHAMKMTKGNGKRQMIVFEDPYCGFCKRMRQSFEQMNDITVYTFLLPILSEDSGVKSRNVWCSANRQKAYDDWMLRGVAPAEAKKDCDDSIAETQALARRLRINGTPAIFFTDGTRQPGFMPPDALEKRLATVKN
jgi:thiol:disulfide interchange protein DsbC